VRPLLVAVGTAFAVVGAGVIVGILSPGEGPQVSRSSSASVDGLTGGSWRPFVLPAVASDPATLSLDWSATTGFLNVPADVNVSLYAAQMCPPATEPCVVPPLLANWNGSGPGHWGTSGSSGSLYMLFITCDGGSNVSVNFTASLVEQYRDGASWLPTVPFAITMVGGGLLTGVGAVALYLGLFLPAGVYTPIEELDGPEYPQDLELGEDSAGPPEPPRPGRPG